MRICIFVVAGVLAASVAAPETGAAGFPGPLLWSAPGPEGLPASREIALDAAARLTEAGRFGSAFDAIEGTNDSLRAGIVACYADRFREGAELLRCRVDNSYLEWLRLYYRALALQKELRPREAIADLDSFFVLTDALAVSPGAPLGAAARDLLLGVAAADDSLFQARRELFDIPPGATARTRVVVAKALFDHGLDSIAARVFLEGSPSETPASVGGLLWEVFEKAGPFLDEAPARELKAIAARAIAESRIAEAERILVLLREMDDTDEALLVLEGRILVAKANRNGALQLFRSVAASGASAQVRADAERRAADLEVRAGDLEGAAERYVALARDTGDPAFIDQAARIAVRLGRFDEALDLWARHDTTVAGRRSGPRSARDASMAIDRAALLHHLARDTEAYEILAGAQGAGERERAGRLYWLSALSPTDSERAAYASELEERFPASFYTGALEGSFDAQARPRAPDERSERLARLVASEWSLIDSLAGALPPEGWFDRHAARQAYRWALDRGLTSEAAEFVLAIAGTKIARAPEVLALHRDARERGYYGFAEWILNGPLAGEVPPVAHALRYPVAYESIVSNGDLAAGLSPELLLAVMYAESKFTRSAVSRSGAVGVMQLMPSTARWFARKRGWGGGFCRDLHDPACNIRIGSHYLAYLLDRADGSLVGALAAYNAGDARMATWRNRFDPVSDPMAALELISPAETAVYVKNVLDAFRAYRLMADGRRETP